MLGFRWAVGPSSGRLPGGRIQLDRLGPPPPPPTLASPPLPRSPVRSSSVVPSNGVIAVADVRRLS